MLDISNSLYPQYSLGTQHVVADRNKTPDGDVNAVGTDLKTYSYVHYALID